MYVCVCVYTCIVRQSMGSKELDTTGQLNN